MIMFAVERLFTANLQLSAADRRKLEGLTVESTGGKRHAFEFRVSETFFEVHIAYRLGG